MVPLSRNKVIITQLDVYKGLLISSETHIVIRFSKKYRRITVFLLFTLNFTLMNSFSITEKKNRKSCNINTTSVKRFYLYLHTKIT